MQSVRQWNPELAAPERAAPRRAEGLTIASAQWPPPHRSGDLLVVRRESGDRATILLADVAGNGGEASGLSAWARGVCERELSATASLGRCLEAVNRICADELPGDVFITALAAQIDARQGILRVASAGHLGPVVRRRDGGCLPAAQPGGPPLGVVRGQRYPETRIRLQAGDLVAFATDGISDRFASERDWSGEAGLGARLNQLPLPPSAICRRLLWDGQAGKETDATAVVVQLPGAAVSLHRFAQPGRTGRLAGG
jgi:serine phosphatase RsbU (regulator of sigma subunit)